MENQAWEQGILLHCICFIASLTAKNRTSCMGISEERFVKKEKNTFFFFYCVIFLYLTATKAGLIFCSKTNLNIQIFLLLYSMKFIHKISGSPFDVIYDIISCFDSNNSIFNSLKNIVKCQIALTAKYIRF